MRRAAKIDSNQPEIVEALRAIGASVATTHTAGKGFPDLVVGYGAVNYLLEIKDGSLSPSARKLTSDQVEFHAAWRGQIEVVESIDDAFRAIKFKEQK
jgi:Holliday junction resolvase